MVPLIHLTHLPNEKNILSILLTLLLVFTWLSFNKTIYAQVNPEEQAKKYQVTFPIAELGNCASFSACRTYCDDATHSDVCIAFAKRKGFYKEKEVDTKKQALILTAKTELGCDSETSCRATCEQDANFEKCQKFAQKNGLGQVPKISQTMLFYKKLKQSSGAIRLPAVKLYANRKQIEKNVPSLQNRRV